MTRCPICGEFDVVLVVRPFSTLGSCPKCGATWAQVREARGGGTSGKASPERAADPESFVTDWALAD